MKIELDMQRVCDLQDRITLAIPSDTSRVYVIAAMGLMLGMQVHHPEQIEQDMVILRSMAGLGFANKDKFVKAPEETAIN